MPRLLISLAVLLGCAVSATAQKEHGFDNRKPSEQPYISAEESVKRFTVHPDYEVKVFAAEPDVINPVAFTVDEKGRLWVVECFEYPKRTPKGKKPRDRVKILEDTDGDGKADKVTVWAEGKDFPTQEYATGFDLATGIEVGHSGVFLGAAPFLYFLKDSKGTGKCDTHEVLLRGFGSHDTHETLNTLQWGPDGQLYGLHGVFTHSQVGDVKMNAAVWRYAPSPPTPLPPGGRGERKGKFEIFGEGTSNPWGMDFDSKGQCFLACCVIPHLFHISPGGTYKRQAGSSFNPHAYGLLNEICDHTHHKESGWAHAGLLYLEGDHVPKDLQGSLIMGSIHGCCIKRNVLKKNGSTFIGSRAPDFLKSDDKNLRPINLRWSPDGSIYLIDWHDQNPCHQTPPDNWDYKHGRIYKIQRKGTKKSEPVDLAKKSSKELVQLLTNDNPWWHRTALRLLNERRDKDGVSQLKSLALQSGKEVYNLRALWGLYAAGAFDEELAAMVLESNHPAMRLWAVRLLGDSGKVSPKLLAKLTAMAAKEPAPEVRLQLASTAQRLKDADVLPLLHNLMKHKADAKDPCLPLMIWLAYEPRLTSKRNPALEWLKENAAGNELIANDIVPRTMRRLIATGKLEDLEACIAFLGEVKDSLVRRKALEGVAEALKTRQLDAPAEWKAVFAQLLKDSDSEVQRLARKLAINFRDPAAVRRALAVVRDSSKAHGERLDAVRALAVALPPEAREPLLDILHGDKDLELRCEACRALSGYDSPDIAKRILADWKGYPPAVRIEAVNLLASRKEWAHAMLSAVGSKMVPRTDLTDSTILRLRAFKDKQLETRIKEVWGEIRDTPADLAKLLDKMRGELYSGPASFERGRKVFDNTCAKCHQFDGRGVEVGPNLDGAARDIEYLLVNVLDPNRVVGAPYFTRQVILKSGKIESGLLAEEDEQSITLKMENAAKKVILKKDVEEVQVSPKSVMPEGLAGTMSVQDFRDLVRYVMAHPFLTNVEVAGPYHPKAQWATGVPSEWKKPAVGAPGRIPLLPSEREGTSIIRAEVTAPTAMRTRLLLGSASELRVTLTGKEVYRGKPGGKETEPDQVAVDVQLNEGKNQFWIEATYKAGGAAVYARLLDPQRKLRYPEGQ
jgi:putative membrane-bound dehydrogenase-like protein